MKKMALIFLLLPTALLAASDKPELTDFPVKVQVVFSRSVLRVSDQQIEAMIDGERVELTGYSQGFLALGDYPARISVKVHGPKKPNSYDIYKGYDFLMPDGKVRTYTVTAVGQSEFPAPPPPSPPAPTSDTPAPVAAPDPPPPPPPPPPAPTTL